jgi:hypothetical protein
MKYSRRVRLIGAVLVLFSLACSLPFNFTLPALTQTPPERPPGSPQPTSRPTQLDPEPISPPDTSTTLTPGEMPTESTDPADPPDLTGDYCEHPYLPMRVGATWNYEDNLGGDFGMTITGMTGDAALSEATVEAVIQSEGETVVFEFSWICTPECVSMPLTGFLGSTSVPTGTITGQTEGVLLPAMDGLTIESTWTYSHTVSFEPFQVGEPFIVTNSRFEDLSHAGFAPVSVPAGDFSDALRVLSHYFGQVNLVYIQLDYTGEATYSFVAGVGLVRYDDVQNGASSVMQLVDYDIPDP